MEMNSEKYIVLHLIKSLGRGGAETLLVESLKLHNPNFEFHYLYFLPWKDQLVESLRTNGGLVSCLPSKNSFFMLWRIPSIVRYIRRNRVDLIHCHLPWAGIVGRVVGLFVDVPVIYTEHNTQLRYNRVTRIANRLTFRLQSLVVAVSHDVFESIKKHIGGRTKVQVILNGVNTSTFKRDLELGKSLREKFGIPPTGCVITTIAVFRSQKRLIQWLQIAAGILKVNKNCYFFLIGDGPLRQEIERTRLELDLEKRVIMPGLQTNVVPWLSATNVYMMSSVFEGLPIALLEAMSMECAVLTTDAGGIKEVVRHGQEGLLVSVKDYICLTDYATQIADIQWCSETGKKARARVVESFSMSAMVTQLEILYMRYITKSAKIDSQ
jgi:L-malate glycosyltransferase